MSNLAIHLHHMAEVRPGIDGEAAKWAFKEIHDQQKRLAEAEAERNALLLKLNLLRTAYNNLASRARELYQSLREDL